MVESTRKLFGSGRVGGQPKGIVCCSEKVKSVIKRKEAAYKVMLGAEDEHTKEKCMEAYREEKRKVKRCIYQSKKEVN